MSDGRAGTPRDALAAFARGPGRPLPVHGYDTAGEAAEKVVFVYRHAERVRAAVQVEMRPGAAGYERRAGPWVLTTFAACDPAEFSPDADDEIGIGIVRTADTLAGPDPEASRLRLTQPARSSPRRRPLSIDTPGA